MLSMCEKSNFSIVSFAKLTYGMDIVDCKYLTLKNKCARLAALVALTWSEHLCPHRVACFCMGVRFDDTPREICERRISVVSCDAKFWRQVLRSVARGVTRHGAPLLLVSCSSALQDVSHINRVAAY